MSDPLLTVQDLHLRIESPDGEIRPLNGVNFVVNRQEIYGLIGETGAGKSLAAWSIVGVLDDGVSIAEGSIRFDDTDLRALSQSQLRRLRGRDLAFVVQNPIGSLNPLQPVGTQIAQMYRIHSGGSVAASREKAIAMLEAVGVPDPTRRAKSYPHELSGGMAQRVLLALAMVNRPKLVIADEPTTGLDLTVQAQILELLVSEVRELGSSVLLITHDLGVVAHNCDRVGVMFAGRIVEEAPVAELFARPRHPYTRALLAATPENSTIDDPAIDSGLPPDLGDLPPGCHYAYRCPYAAEACLEPVPLVEVGPRHPVLCRFPHEES